MNDTGEAHRARQRGNGIEPIDPDPNRRSPDAASVSSRWWEVGSGVAAAPGPSLQPPPPPPRPTPLTAAGKAPPPPPLPSQPADQRASRPEAEPVGDPADRARIQRLEQELAASRDEAAALHEMLEDLPEIFERKFRQRLQGVLDQQRLLLADNRLLRDQLYALQPASDSPEQRPGRLLPPALTPPAATPDRPEPLRRVLHRIRRLGGRLRPGGSGTQAGEDDLSDRDDGRPRAA